LVAERRASPDEDRDDLFSSLIRAADLETDEKSRLNDDDLVGTFDLVVPVGHQD